MSNELPLNGAPDPEELERLDLGDSVADDRKLEAFLKSLEEEANRDAPSTQRGRTLDLLGIVKAPFKTAWSATKKGFAWLKERLTNYEITRAKVKLIEAEAGKRRAEATTARKVGAAKAEVLEAQAEQIRTETRLKLIRELEARGIDWQAELTEEGHLNVVATKKQKKKRLPSED